MTPLKDLLGLADYGWHLFPLAPNSKVPPRGSHGVSDATTDKATISAWHDACPEANWAVNCGASNLVVLDVDSYKSGASEAIAALDLEHGIPPTLTVRTPSGGTHYYYKGSVASTVCRIGPGIDTRGKGGYVVIPGSTIDGKPYHVEDTSAIIAPAPKWIIDKAGSPLPVQEKTVAAMAGPVDTPEACEAVRRYLLVEATPAIEGEGGDATTLRVAMRCKDLGVSEGQALELMATLYNPRCEPAWDLGDLERKCANAYRYGKRPVGSASLAATGFVEVEKSAGPDPFDDVVPQLDTDEGDLSVGADEFLDHPAGLRPWILGHDLMAGFVTGTIAQPGVGKSMISMAECMAIASGQPLTGVPVTKQGVVWIYNLEDPLDELNRRVCALAQHYGLSRDVLKNVRVTSGQDKKFKIARSKGGTVTIDQAAVARVVKHIKRLGIICWCLDPFVYSHSCAENSNDEMAAIMETYSQIARDTGCAINLVHHSSKGTGAGGDMNKARGASAITGACRIIRHAVPMDLDLAKEYGVLPTAADDYVGLYGAKASMSKEEKAPRWFEKMSITLPIGESVGAVQPRALAKVQRENLLEVRDAVLHLVRDGYYEDGAVTLLKVSKDISDQLGSDLRVKKGLIKHIEDSFSGGVTHVPRTDKKITIDEIDGKMQMIITSGHFDWLE